MQKDWENPRITNFRRMKSRSVLIPFEERAAAFDNDKIFSGIHFPW